MAQSLFVATPTETTRPTSSRTRCLIVRPIVSPSPNAAVLAVTSRKASSRLIGSTSGVYEAKIAMTSSLASRYRSGRPGTKMPSGQRRAAVRSGIAEKTPNARASYEAALTTPRSPGRPPTMTGLPRSDGSSSCSTLA